MICDRWPNLRPIEVVQMPWHERWFYLDWLLDDAADAQAGSGGAFDANAPWSGGHLTPEVAAGLGAQVREIS